MLEKTLESPLDCKEIQPVNPKGDQSWVFTGRTDAEDETPNLWSPDAESRFIGKDPDPGKDRRQEKGAADNEMDGITNSMDMNFSKFQEIVEDKGTWCATVRSVTESDRT